MRDERVDIGQTTAVNEYRTHLRQLAVRRIDALRMAHDDVPKPIQTDAFKTRAHSSKLKKLTDEERAHLRSMF
jgi:hypothetical protein